MNPNAGGSSFKPEVYKDYMVIKCLARAAVTIGSLIVDNPSMPAYIITQKAEHISDGKALWKALHDKYDFSGGTGRDIYADMKAWNALIGFAPRVSEDMSVTLARLATVWAAQDATRRSST